jgi:hypothetical protein
MQTVQMGSRGPEVVYLQRMLNLRMGSRLREDGVFGPLTKAALVAWQSSQRRSGMPIADPATFTALGMRTLIEHPIQQFGQPTGMTCWSASMTMVEGTNRSVGQGSAQLGATGGLVSTPDNVAVFAREHGMRVLSSMSSYSVDQLIGWMRNGPLIAIGAGSGRGGRWAHASVLSAIYSDQNANGTGTVMRIHDPEPVGVGSVYGVVFTGANQAVPGARYDLFGAFLIGK